MLLIRRLESIRRREHEATVELIEALVECQRSKAHVDAGHPTVWDLLVRRLEYSNAAASRRYKAMKCALRAPLAIDLLRRQRTSLTALAKVESAVRVASDPEAVLREIEGMSALRLERWLAERHVETKPRERVRRLAVRPGSGRTGATPSEGVASLAVRSSAPLDSFSGAPRDETSKAANPPMPAIPAPLPSSPRVELRFSLSDEDYARFERALALLSRKLGPVPSIEEALNELVSFYLARNPIAKQRSDRASSSAAELELPTARIEDGGSDAGARTDRSRPRRRIRTAIREEVFRRDDHRCTYVARDGRRCSAVHDLQLDHILPHALGGGDEATNLRLLCGAHNRRRAALRFGAPHRSSGGDLAMGRPRRTD